jgi:CRP-like cAMP-binding protein
MPETSYRNRILNRLSPSERDALIPHLRPVDLPQGKVLTEPGSPARHIYFIEAGMSSATALSSEGDSIEVGVAGREGLVGIGSLLGHEGMPHRSMMQGGGNGYSIPVEIVRPEFLKGGPFALAVHDFVYAQLTQASQCALCNRIHAIEPRLARWLLTASDVMETPVLHLTQEFVAEMIGAERSSATIAAGSLKRAGLIEYRRGLVEILDRPMLEDAACECYRLLRGEYDKIYGRT